MPTIARRGSYKMVMYFKDHRPPHVHVRGGGGDTMLLIKSGETIGAALPAKTARWAREYVEAHRARLLALWDRYE